MLPDNAVLYKSTPNWQQHTHHVTSGRADSRPWCHHSLCCTSPQPTAGRAATRPGRRHSLLLLMVIQWTGCSTGTGRVITTEHIPAWLCISRHGWLLWKVGEVTVDWHTRRLSLLVIDRRQGRVGQIVWWWWWVRGRNIGSRRVNTRLEWLGVTRYDWSRQWSNSMLHLITVPHMNRHHTPIKQSICRFVKHPLNRIPNGTCYKYSQSNSNVLMLN